MKFWILLPLLFACSTNTERATSTTDDVRSFVFYGDRGEILYCSDGTLNPEDPAHQEFVSLIERKFVAEELDRPCTEAIQGVAPKFRCKEYEPLPGLVTDTWYYELEPSSDECLSGGGEFIEIR